MKTGRPRSGCSDNSRIARCESSWEANSTILVMAVSNTKTKCSEVTHPQPLETPVGVTRTSAKRTSPAANQKLPSISSQQLDHSIKQKLKHRLLSATKLSCPEAPGAKAPVRRRGLLKTASQKKDHHHNTPIGLRHKEPPQNPRKYHKKAKIPPPTSPHEFH